METREAVVVFQGTQVEAETLNAMLNARGIAAKVTRDREVEGATAIVEAVIFVPPEQADEATVLINDVKTTR